MADHHDILRYANRKLYSCAVSDYVSRQRIASFIGAGDTIKVLQASDKKDITTDVLIQVLQWQCAQGFAPPLDVVTLLACEGQKRLAASKEVADAVA